MTETATHNVDVEALAELLVEVDDRVAAEDAATEAQQHPA